MTKTVQDAEAARVHGVRLTHPDKPLYPELGLTKGDLADYYAAVGQRMLPYVRNRLLSLVRCPDGRGEPCFFQKHPGRGAPPTLRVAEIVEGDGGHGRYIFIVDVAGLVSLVQIGTLEIHLWGSSVDDIERPDRLVMDIDPDEGLPFAEVKRAARAMRDRLADLGLGSYALVTGGKGVHVVAPLERRRDWNEVKAFARALAGEMARGDPDRFVDVASKQRRRGRIFVDYLRNDRGSTAVAPYSTRARKGAPVAVPVGWDELGRLSKSNGFSVADVVRRVKKGIDPWADYFDRRQSVTKRALDAVGAKV